MHNTQSPARLVISVDVTDWSKDQRSKLLTGIADLEAGAAAEEPIASGLEDVDATGWTLEAYHEAMAGLLGKYFVQANVINEAIKTGDGYINRETVYALGSYTPTRSLKGFTRPVNRIVENLVEAGKLPEDAEDLLAPVYDPNIKGYQRARGFQVPLEVVKILLEERQKSAASQ